MTSGALIGVVCGLATGMLVGILWLYYLIYLKKRKEREIKRLRKKSYPIPGPTIIKPTIPAFTVPHLPLVPVPVQFPTTSDAFLKTPPRTPSEYETRSNCSRRSSVQLEDILTSVSAKDNNDSLLSPNCVKATNEPAIASLGLGYSQTKKKIGRRSPLMKSSASSVLGKLEFSLFYDQNGHELQIYIVRALQVYIPGLDAPNGLIVKAVVLFNGEEVWTDKTKPTEACSDPDFLEQLTVHGLPSKKMRKGSLRLIVMDDDTGLEAGEVVYYLCNLPFNHFTNEIMKLTEIEDANSYEKEKKVVESNKSVDLGQLNITMYHKRNDKTLCVGVESARGLPDMTRGTAVDSYIKVSVMFFGKKLYSRSTKVVSKNRNPLFGEEFEFAIPSDKIPQITVIFKVKYHGKMRDSTIGMVKLGYDADKETEYRHLEQCLDKPHLSIENWHDIRKC